MNKFFTLLVAILFAIPSTQAISPRGNLNYNVDLYENDIEISSTYNLQSNEFFFVNCDKPGDEFLSARTAYTKDNLIIFPSMIWNTTFVCHISVVDSNRKGRVVKSSGNFLLRTPGYFK